LCWDFVWPQEEMDSDSDQSSVKLNPADS